MNRLSCPVWLRLRTAVLLGALVLLSACQAFPGGLPFLSMEQKNAAGRVTPGATSKPLPTLTPHSIETLPPTYTPVAESESVTQTPAALPDLMADFPLFDGAEVSADESYAAVNSAGVAVRAHQSPGELEAYYQQALQAKGWLLRYREGNAVGGFVQEWKKEKALLTVEYHFANGQPLVNADLRVIETNQALGLLLGFPLPNGTEVLNASGSTIELYVPQDLKSTVDFFRKQVAGLRWPFQAIDPTGWCGSRGCNETMEENYRTLVALEPLPTPDRVKPEYYRMTMPDRTLDEVTFLPRDAHTRVYIALNFKNLARSGIPVALYPNATVTGIMPGVAMFAVKADIKDVIKFYEDGMAGLGWKPMWISVNQPDKYARTWRKDPSRNVSLTLSLKKEKVYGTITCSGCSDPYFVLPTSTPTVAPSK